MDYIPEFLQKQFDEAYEETFSAGLSKAHISPHGFKPTNRAGNYKKPSAAFYLGGSLVKVCRGGIPGVVGGGGIRGKVAGFSFASRRRLMGYLAMVKRSEKPLFVTFTYPDTDYSRTRDYKYWKRDIDTFRKRLLRRFPKSGFIWKQELQDRKSGAYIGEVFPHFHMFVWGVQLHELREFCKRAWYEVVGTGDYAHFNAGTRVEEIKSVKGVFSYAAKYFSKEERNLQIDKETGEIKGCGRWWGICGRENIPWAHACRVQLTAQEALQLVRYLRRYARLKPSNNMTMKCFCDAEQWFDKLVDLLYPK